MRTSKLPPKADLLPYVDDRKAGAEKFGVTTKTIVRWLQEHGLYNPKPKYGSNKLNMDKAREIRKLHRDGRSMTDLASDYGVTVSTVSRIVQNVTYHEEKEVADVSVIYNPTPISSLVVGVFESSHYLESSGDKQ